MYENLSYELLKELPGEQKKNALIELKGKYPHYKEMAEKIGGTPVALANLYLRIVEGKKFGRRKKEVVESSILETPVINEEKQKRTRRKIVKAVDAQIIPAANVPQEIMIKSPVIVDPVIKSALFVISLEIEETGKEAKERIDGIIGSLLKEKKYKMSLRIEEV